MVGRKGRKEVIVNSEFKIAVYLSGVGCVLICITRKGSACGRRQVVGREVDKGRIVVEGEAWPPGRSLSVDIVHYLHRRSDDDAEYLSACSRSRLITRAVLGELGALVPNHPFQTRRNPSSNHGCSFSDFRGFFERRNYGSNNRHQECQAPGRFAPYHRGGQRSLPDQRRQ